MILKNISGVRKTFGFGRKVSATLEANQLVTIPDDNDNLSDANKWAAMGFIEILSAPSGVGLFQSRSKPSHLRVELGDVAQLVGNTAASGTLTSDNTNVADGATVTIDTKVYTFRTALTPTEGEVLIGGSADASLLNLIRAINHTGTPNTDYKCAAAHPTVSAAASVTSHAFAITALTAGVGGNSIATTETSAHLSFGSATLTSGATADPSPDAGKLTIGTQVFEIEVSGGVTGDNTPVAVGASAGACAANLKTAINANSVLAALGIVATDVVAVSTSQAFTVVEVPAAVDISALTASVSGGNSTMTVTKVTGATPSAYVALLQSFAVTGTSQLLVTGFVSIAEFLLQVRTAAGIIKRYNGVITKSGGSLFLDASGDTDLASTDTIVLFALGNNA